MRISQRSSSLDLFCEGLIEASWLTALLVVPLFFVAFSDRPFDPAKAVLLESVVLLATMAWLVKVVTGGRPALPWPRSGELGLRPERRTLLLIAVLFWTGAQLVTLFTSLDPDLSWRGSYNRAFGAGTRLTLVVLFWMIVAHLRSASQLRRLVLVLLGGSLPVCLFALLQRLGIDPVARRLVVERPETTLGNPIFLGAFLCLALFHSAALASAVGLYDPLVHARDGWRRGVAFGVLGVQALALLLSGSRGPILGVASGILVFGLLAFADRVRQEHETRRRGWRLGVLLLLLVVLAFAVGRGHRPVERLEADSRLSTLFDAGSPTAQVRRLVWLSGLHAFETDAPLLSALGSDPHPGRRWWLGFGAETSAFALDQHRDPRLNLLEGDKVPDRAHNQILQALLDSGLLGVLAWAFLQLAIADTAAVALFSASRRARFGFAVALLGAATVGAGLGQQLAPEFLMLGAVAGAGLLLGCVLVSVALLGKRSSGAPPPARDGHRLAIALLVAAFAAHLVEGQFGIDVVAVRLLFWVGLALFVVLSCAPGLVQSGAARVGASLRGAPELTLLLLLCVGYVMLVGRLGPQAAAGLLEQPRWSVWWLLGTSLVVCWTLGDGEASPRGLARYLLPPMVILGSSVLALSRHIPVSGAGLMPDRIYVREAALVQVVFLLLFVLATWIGWRLAPPGRVRGGARGGVAGGPDARRLSVAVGLLLLCAAFVLTRLTLPVRAAIAAKMAERAGELGETGIALELLDRAHDLDSSEARFSLLWAQSALGATQRGHDDEQRAALVTEAGERLEAALRQAPFDADHVANLGRYFSRRSELASTEEERRRQLARASESLRRGMAMRPASPTLLVDLAAIEKACGDTEAALRWLGMARRLGSRDNAAVVAEVRLREELLGEAGRKGDLREVARQRERIEILLAEALERVPSDADAREALRRLQRR